MQRLGVISYATYLWNYLIVCWLRGGGSGEVTPFMGALSIPLSIGAAILSWFLVERPVKRRWNSNPPVSGVVSGEKSLQPHPEQR